MEDKDLIEDNNQVNKGAYQLRSKRAASESPEKSENPSSFPKRRQKRNKKSPKKSPKKTPKKNPKKPKNQDNMEGFQAALDSIIKSNQVNSNKLDQLMNKQEETTLKLHQVTEKIDLLNTSMKLLQDQTNMLEKKQEEAVANINCLFKNTSDLQHELNQVRQATLANDLVIQGIPSDLMPPSPQDALILIAKSLGVIINVEHIKQATVRKHIPSKTSRLLVSLHNGHIKQNLLEKFKLKKPLLAEEIFTNISETSPFRGKGINIFNQLTATNMKILLTARKANNGRFNFIWEKGGRILMIQNNEAKVIEVRSMQQLATIFGPEISQSN